MLDEVTAIAAATDLRVAEEHKRPIAIVGAGAIVDVAHLPAYRRAGLDVAGIFDLDQDRAHEVAARHGIPAVYQSLDELLSSPVDVVDIAVPARAQPAIVHRAVDAGKHLLCQKPFAEDLATARRMVAAAEQANRKIAVNQQMRFEEGIAAAIAMARAGWVGEVTAFEFNVTIVTDFSTWAWLAELENLEIWYHSIHYLDSVRALLGNPNRAYAIGSRTPGQKVVGETRTATTLSFPGGEHAILHVNHENRTGDARAEYRIDGSEGSIKGTIGLLYDYPHGRPDTLRVNSEKHTDGWLDYPVTRRWIPDAFAGPMGSLLRAIATDTEPETSGRDNLGTLALVEALYRSMATGEAQTPEESPR
ncbi:Gfo/Idh/MocA family protein [Cryptosporangium phraense]|uniref:Gfo/Idh/MocA family oxidoreductase n=1 Tax=Cryptosporangium phraense TaxID=2593070 RepID=A0A545AJC6_9ACTN|nr:Gfo/Idh/MocA family oxidoreductase [Cryptosporangium phraense]TQS40795.1 Gfo/Idh/MocA family oxidoreductase [Cryptosporangium phraense]